ncbi:MAG: hypothetical protein KKE02_08690 [Alphaproteobacteria bacterium]|nr:hypothetical protein [Alphaproteobacteria bacterium]MBU1513530.1 hypothetical protein [Alphaproteobacteria bacterium]MBU2094825.1 hypothetical protein [Alphaproteobacteria bacterium]MBU2151082.1 hypothetical protein [Alphaproteobacteria bacterium]MBU2309365.1 hypothetical protein [Alphaproteobacteria bacterium]
MDKPFFPTTGGCTFVLEAAGEAWSWRLTTPDGAHVGGLAPDRSAAGRSAAFAASAVSALRRTRERRF